MLPVQPRRRIYTGSKEPLRRKADEFNAMARRVARHVNALCAENPAEVQQYLYARIASDMGLTVDEVRSAIGTGGYHGITVTVSEREREILATRGPGGD